MPPHDRILDHAAETLTTILTDDSFGALMTACRNPRVRTAVIALLEELAKARSFSPAMTSPAAHQGD